MGKRRLRIGVLGSGSGTNCEAILLACERNELAAEVVIVISDVATAPILERARQRGIRAEYIGPSRFQTKLEPDLEERAAQCLRDTGVELVALAGYMRVVKTPLLRTFAGRMLNIHPALLPAFPGLHSWEQALNYGAKVAGCTVHFVNEGVDTGPIVLQESVPVREDDTPATLHQRIQEVEHRLYPTAIRLFAEGRLKIDGRRVRIAES